MDRLQFEYRRGVLKNSPSLKIAALLSNTPLVPHTSASSTKHQRHSSPGSKDWMMGWRVA